MTPLMLADEVATAFNGASERRYWRAVTGGGRLGPTVIFKSRASMVEITYSMERKDFTVVFNKTQCAFGDFVASAHRSLSQILLALKAAGAQVSAPLDESAELRLVYDPKTKQTRCSLNVADDDWFFEPQLSFKVLANNLPDL